MQLPVNSKETWSRPKVNRIPAGLTIMKAASYFRGMRKRNQGVALHWFKGAYRRIVAIR